MSDASDFPTVSYELQRNTRERGGGGLDSLPTDFDQNATVRVEPDADTDSEVGAVVCVCVCV